MSTTDFAQALEENHQAQNAIVRGDPEPRKALFSRAEDVTLASPIGPPVRGRAQVEAALDRAAAQVREGEPVQFQLISQVVTDQLAYVVEIERWHGKVGNSQEVLPLAIRSTTVFRREEGQWKVCHRHADPITSDRPMESIIEH